MVLLAPTVTALQTLLEVCRAYAGPHDIAYNTTKAVCMLVRPKQSHGQSVADLLFWGPDALTAVGATQSLTVGQHTSCRVFKGNARPQKKTHLLFT